MWGVKKTTPDLLKKHSFLYDNSLMGDYMPYRINAGGSTLVQIPISLILDDSSQFLFFPVMGSFMNSAQHAYQTWMEEFDAIRERGGVFALIQHPNVTGHPGKLQLLRNMLEHMGKHDDVWFATGREVAEHCMKFA